VVLIVARTSSQAGIYSYGAERKADRVADEERDGASLPLGWTLGPSYPNPFNVSTLIPLGVPDGEPTSIAVEIYDVAGRKVTSLAGGVAEPGRYLLRWQGEDACNHSVGSGLYVVRLRAGDMQLAQKVMLVR
jgi:hypothetical protein